MDPLTDRLLNINRRALLKGAGGLGLLGGPALGQLLAGTDTVTPIPSHFAPKAKRIIYLFQEGAPSQIDTFDHKPGLKDLYNKDLPPSVRGSQRLTGMTAGQSRLPIAPSSFNFTRHANQQDGLWVSDLLHRTGEMAGDLCVIKSMHTEQINHSPCLLYTSPSPRDRG